MISLISLLGNTVSVVEAPTGSGALQSIDWNITTAVANVSSIYTGQVQTQQWPGADAWAATVTFPPLTRAQFNPWKAALMQMQGMSNALQMGDPEGATPLGNVQGAPVVDGSIAVVAGSNVLYTMGWTPSQINLLMPGDYIQVGYRLHSVLDAVISDSSGKAAINIWPSLREVPSGGEQIVTTNTVGLFRLGSNKVTWSTSVDHLYHLSFQINEFK